jgi:hypothetical protein
MIKANELRIGNCVNYTLPEVIQEFDDGTAVAVRDKSVVCSGKIQEVNRTGVVIEGNSVRSSFISPIPLTPEILERCGFGKMVMENERQSFSLEKADIQLRIYISKNNIFTFLSVRGSQETVIFLTQLHQLQNIYPLLWCEELEMEL